MKIGNGTDRQVEFSKRKSMRLKGYDYSQNGAYFITICAVDRKNLFCEIPIEPTLALLNENLTSVGKIVRDCWIQITEIYFGIESDCFIVMPDHFHGIIMYTQEPDSEMGGQCRPPLQKVVQGYKSVTTRLCFQYGHRKIWQRSFYDHIIRNEIEYLRICDYIENNPFCIPFVRKNEELLHP